LYVEVGGTLSALLRRQRFGPFSGRRPDRADSLFGFVLSGLIETVGYFHFNQVLRTGGAGLHIPMGWMVSRTLLAVLLLAAFGVEKVHADRPTA
jgi:hypothetical protein